MELRCSSRARSDAADMNRTVKEDNFEIEEDTGAINVHVMIQQETFDEYPESYFDLPEAREYIALNPRYREGRDLCYAYPYSAGNVLSMLWRYLHQNWLQRHHSARSTIQSRRKDQRHESSASADVQSLQADSTLSTA